ncbi:hypothetical protein GCM10022234_00720 [Aeromicrobium panaciterrae]
MNARHRAPKTNHVPWWLKMTLAATVTWALLWIGAWAYLYTVWSFA